MYKETLQERYTNARVTALQKKLTSLDENVNRQLDEHLSIVISEAFNRETATKAIALIKQLNSIPWPGELALFSNASKAAVAELQRVLAGQGRKKGVFNTLVNMFKRQDDNPFIDVIAYANAVHQFFSVMQEYVEAAKEGNEVTLGNVFKGNDDAFKKIVQKGLKPEGLIANLGTNWMKKFMKDDPDLSRLMAGLSKLPLQKLESLAKHVTQKLNDIDDISNAVAAADQAATSNKDVPVDKGTTPSQQAEPTTPAGSTTPTQEEPVMPGKQDKNFKRKAISAMKDELTKAGVTNVEAVYKVLSGLKMLKLPE